MFQASSLSYGFYSFADFKGRPILGTLSFRPETSEGREGVSAASPAPLRGPPDAPGPSPVCSVSWATVPGNLCQMLTRELLPASSCVLGCVVPAYFAPPGASSWWDLDS